MAYLVVKRLWDDELVPILSTRCSRGTATAALAIAYCQPGKRVGESQPGDVYFVIVHERTGDRMTAPVIFPPDAARPVLIMLDVPAGQVDVVLSDGFADNRLAVLRAQAPDMRQAKRSEPW